MNGWVIDSSLALAWTLPDERSPSADKFWKQITSKVELCAPALWWYEIANALVMAKRRRRISEADASRAAGLFRELPVKTDQLNSLERCIDLASKYSISAYDAAYLELAIRLGLGLASLDNKLVAAAKNAGVDTW
jgi:predicted nucleic acid-binding protein